MDKHCKSITFEPIGIWEGKLGVKDYSKELKRFAKGTIGEINGCNWKVVDCSDMTVKDLLKYVS
jgi:hypothetical protein